MEQNQPLTPTPADQWQGSIAVAGTDLELPSGNVARVKQIAPQAFLASGMIPNPLMAIISKAINDQQGLKPKDVDKLTNDPKLLVSALELFDRVLTYVAVLPKISMPPACSECGEYANTSKHDPGLRGGHPYEEGPREPGVLYADMVVMQDKTFIFQWALGGTRDLEQFRREFDASVGVVPDR